MMFAIILLSMVCSQELFERAPSALLVQPFYESEPSVFPTAIIPNLKHVDPPIAKRRLVWVYTTKTEKQLEMGDSSCRFCLKWFRERNHPKLSHIKFRISNKFPDGVNGEPTFHWNDLKGGGHYLSGWEGVDKFLIAWEGADKVAPPPVPKASSTITPQRQMAVIPHTINGSFQPSINVLRRHLSGSPHFINTQGMTYDQMLYEHNRWHTLHGPR